MTNLLALSFVTKNPCPSNESKKFYCSGPRYSPSTGETFGVLVVEAGGQAVEDSQGGEVFAGNHLQTLPLSILLLLDQTKNLRISDGERIVEGP